jgi:ABC-type phosphate transport system permease subunit
MASLYAARRRRNVIAMCLSLTATALGLGWLVLILGALLWQGFSGLSLSVFTEMTPPPGGAGGLLNPIFGSLILTVLAVMIGTPIGILAGTYMAEYGRHTRLTSVVRFINDILLSAPSIVVGLFIYEVMVAPMGHFSGLAGGAHHRGHAQPGAQPAARGGGVARHAARLHHCADMLPGRTGRHDHRRSARHCAHLGRDCSAPVHRA